MTVSSRKWIVFAAAALAVGLFLGGHPKLLPGAALLSMFIGANRFSMSALYRNRLIRAYLGASRYSRDPDRFTGFDEDDNLQMYEIRHELLWPTSFGDVAAFIVKLLE